MSPIDGLASAFEFFRNIDEIAKQRDDDKGEMNGLTVKNIHGTESYINRQPAEHLSISESEPTSLSSLIEFINKKIKQGPEITEEMVDQSLKIYQKPSLNRLRSGDVMLSAREIVDIYELLEIDIKGYTTSLEKSRKRQHSDESNESVNKKRKQEFTTSTNLTTDATTAEIANGIKTSSTQTDNISKLVDQHQADQKLNTIDTAMLSEPVDEDQIDEKPNTTNIGILPKSIQQELLRKQDILRLLQQIELSNSPSEWKTMFFSLINQNLIEIAREEPNIYALIKKRIDKLTSYNPSEENKELKQQLFNNYAHYQKQIFLLFKKDIDGQSYQDIGLDLELCRSMISASKMCSANLCVLVASYNSIFSEDILSLCIPKEPLLQSPAILNNAISVINKLDFLNDAIERADSSVQLIYKISCMINEQKMKNLTTTYTLPKAIRLKLKENLKLSITIITAGLPPFIFHPKTGKIEILTSGLAASNTDIHRVSGNKCEVVDNQLKLKVFIALNQQQIIGTTKILPEVIKQDVLPDAMQQDIKKLLQIDIDTQLEQWSAKLIIIIRTHLQQLISQQEESSLFKIIIASIIKATNNTPDLADELNNLQCHDSTPDSDKLFLLLYLYSQMKARGYSFEFIEQRTTIKEKKIRLIIDGFKKCSPNLFVLLSSYKSCMFKHALLIKHLRDNTDENKIKVLFDELNNAVDVAEEMQFYNIITTYTNSNVEALFLRVQNKKQALEQKVEIIEIF